MVAAYGGSVEMMFELFFSNLFPFFLLFFVMLVLVLNKCDGLMSLQKW